MEAKKFDARNRKSSQLKKELNRIIETHEYYKNCIFWSVRDNRRTRDWRESKFEEENPDVEITTKDGIIKATQSMRMSCSNVYFSKEYSLNGEVKDIRLIKKLLK